MLIVVNFPRRRLCYPARPNCRVNMPPRLKFHISELRTPLRSPVSVLVGAEIHRGTYAVDDGVVTTTYAGTIKSAALGKSRAETVARALLGQIVDAAISRD
jgi:hypothetical protein